MTIDGEDYLQHYLIRGESESLTIGAVVPDRTVNE